jgi:hypothetical protein
MATPNVSIGVSDDWREWSAAQIAAANGGTGLNEADLTHNGQLPRRVVMKAEGNLVVTNAYGVLRVLTGLPEWYSHEGAIQSVGPTQAVDIIVYW